MHEVSLAEGIAEIVTRTAENAGADRISKVRIEVGELSNVVIESLAFAFESVKKGTVMAEADLVIERTPGMAWCTDCGKEVPLHKYGDPCPVCGGAKLFATKGREMKVLDIEAAD